MRGARDSQEQALPRRKEMAKRPNNCQVEDAGSDSLDFSPNALPIDRVVKIVSSARPRSVSATIPFPLRDIQKGEWTVSDELQHLDSIMTWIGSCFSRDLGDDMDIQDSWAIMTPSRKKDVCRSGAGTI